MDHKGQEQIALHRWAVIAEAAGEKLTPVTRLRTLVAAGNRASLALLAEAGRVSSGLPEQGVLDVRVELPAATRARSTVEKAADLWAQGARKLIDQTYMFPPLPQAGLIPAVERYFEFVQRMAEMNRDLTVEWVQAASGLSGVAWEQAPAEPAGDVVRERAATAGRQEPGLTRRSRGTDAARTSSHAARVRPQRAARKRARAAFKAQSGPVPWAAPLRRSSW